MMAPESEKKIAAKRAEVASHYKRERRRKNKGGFRFTELQRVFRRRGVPEVEVSNQIANLGNIYKDWTPQELGQHINLTYEESDALGIRTIRYCDLTEAQEAEVARRKADQKRERDKVRKQRKRAAQPKPPKGLSDRARELFECIGTDYVPRSKLVAASEGLTSFRRRGKPLDYKTRKKAVIRAVAELAAAGLIETDNSTVDRRGQPIVIVRRCA